MNVPKLRFKEFNDEWKNASLGDITTFKQGIQIDVDKQKTKPNDNSIRFIRIVDYTQNTKDLRYIDLPNNANFVDESDVVLVRYGATAGYVGHGIKGVIANNMFTVRPNDEEELNKDFLYTILKQDKIYNILNNSNGSSAMPALNFGSVSKLKLKYPSLKEQKKLVNVISLIDKKIELQSKKIEDLKLFKLSIKNNIFKKLEDSNKLNIEDILDFEQPTKYIVNSEEYTNNKNDIPVLTANKAFILGYCKEDNFYNNQCIIFDDFTLDIKYVDFPFKVKSSAIKILTPKENFNLKYIFEYMQYLDLHSEEHKRHYISIVQKIKIPVPAIENQILIANKLECFDNKINLEVNKLKKLIELKKGLMQSMFV